VKGDDRLFGTKKPGEGLEEGLIDAKREVKAKLKKKKTEGGSGEKKWWVRGNTEVMGSRAKPLAWKTGEAKTAS